MRAEREETTRGAAWVHYPHGRAHCISEQETEVTELWLQSGLFRGHSGRVGSSDRVRLGASWGWGSRC